MTNAEKPMDANADAQERELTNVELDQAAGGIEDITILVGPEGCGKSDQTPGGGATIRIR